MPSPGLPHGFRARPASFDDVEGVASVIAACEAAHGQGFGITPEVLRNIWRTLDLASESLVIESMENEIVAAADIENRDYVAISTYGHVHPRYRGRGIGSFIVEWGERWARDRMDRAPVDAQIVTRHSVPSTDTPALALLQDHGYRQLRATYIMAIQLDSPPPDPAWPAGISQTPYRPHVDEREIYEAVEDAFRDVWGRSASSFERFLKNRPNRREQADLWIVARDGREIAGVSLGKVMDETGWIDNVGVRRAWRRQGLGLALLHAGFGAFHRRGVTDVRLTVDAESLTGAPRLYERAGMRVAASYILHEKALRPGVDPGDRSI